MKKLATALALTAALSSFGGTAMAHDDAEAKQGKIRAILTVKFSNSIPLAEVEGLKDVFSCFERAKTASKTSWYKGHADVSCIDSAGGIAGSASYTNGKLTP